MNVQCQSDLPMEDKLYVYLLSQLDQVRDLVNNDWDEVPSL